MGNEMLRPIEVITQEINFYKERAGESIYEIGKRLNEAKAQLQHGEWLSWLEEKVNFSEASAQRFMRIAKEYSNPSPVTDLGMSKALVLLSLSPEEREEFIAEKHEVNGEEKTVEEMSKRELEKVIKERDAALKEKEDLSFEITDLEEKIRDLTDELNELKDKPTVIAEPGEEELNKIREEAEVKLKSKIEKLEKKLLDMKSQKEKAEKEAEEVKGQLAEADENKKTEVEKVREEKRILEERIEELNKKLKVNSSDVLTEFKLYFNTAKEYVNKMLGIISKLEKESEDRAKLHGMVSKFIELIKETLGGM